MPGDHADVDQLRGRSPSVAESMREVVEGLPYAAPNPVWITLVEPAEILSRAAALDAVPPNARGPLHGAPFAVKDNIDVAGLPTTAACPDFAYTAARSAPAVQRLLDAGAVLVGKTNLDQFATGLTGTRSPYGACDSVFGGGLVSGGSSSGSAVSVAERTVEFSLGTDTAGSGRVPAAFNGIVGLKPTRGLVSTAGVVPACRSLDCVSVFGRDVADAWAVLRVLAGPDPDDPWSRPGPRLGPLGAEAPRWRFGVPSLSAGDFYGDLAMRDRFLAGVGAIEALASGIAGVDLDPFLEAGALLYDGPWVAERLGGLAGFLAARPESVLPVTRAVLERGRDIDAVTTFAALHRLQYLKRVAERVFADVDILVLPTVATTVTHADVQAEPLRRNAELGRYTQFANLLDLAVVCVPNGCTNDGRPAGLSLVGPAFSDATLAAAARAFTRVQAGPSEVELAVVGHHLTGGPRNGELRQRGGRLLATTTTAPAYRLYRLPGAGPGVPGLVRCPVGDPTGAAIEVEVWTLPTEHVGGFLAGVNAPLGVGRVELVDGREVLGFLCEAYATRDAADITAAGGWRAHLAASVEP